MIDTDKNQNREK